MKFISKSSDLKKAFIKLLKKYQFISFATAWASSNHSAFEELFENEKKIKHSTIGIHFYQTDPKVLESFENSKSVKFVLQDSGTFHPKIYLFWNNENEWSLLSGSANFTNGAFDGNNTENMLLISDKDDADANLFREIHSFIVNQFKSEDAKEISSDYINKYRNLYETQRKISSTLYGRDECENNSKPILETKILTYSWEEYFNEIKKDPYHGFEARLDMLSEIQNWFESHEYFSQLSEPERKFIMGLPSELNDKKYAWFGHLKPRWRVSAHFREAIQKDTHLIGQAIDQIPLKGNVTKNEFLTYSQKLYSIFQNKEFAASMRLLSMKRPDLYFSMNGKNKKFILKDLGLKDTKDPRIFWDNILSKIYSTPWFNSDEPEDPTEKLAWKYRVALIDCIYYEA